MSDAKKKPSQPSKWLSASKVQCSDTGQAMILICLLLVGLAKKPVFLPVAIVLLILNMIAPKIYAPLARLWFGLSHVMGSVMSKLLLGVVFYLVLTPVGVARRLFGRDAMQVKAWKKDSESVFRVREHTFSKADIEQPY